MSQELAEVSCRACGDRAAVELGESNAFTLDCDTCGAASEGRYRPDGVVVWR
ncbi:hypothetical protein [Halorarius halobius]|uniref:hypothetical protein n=1 Tax=Halorarius halobius TaxID=2962671 RepID=UPI0020CC6B71|nr:hypothetical protein [Halorarius halobius]